MPDLMTSSGTPFLRFSPQAGWPTTGPERQSVPVDKGPLRLAVPGRRPIAMAESFGSFGGLRLPRGMAIGPEGRIFLADPAAGVVLTALAADCVEGAAPFRPLWPRRIDPTDAYFLAGPTDVAILANGDLAIADPSAGRVLVLAWPSAAIRRDLRIKGWAPTALAVDNQGRLIVADPGLGRLHRFDTIGRRDPNWPHASVVWNKPEFVAVARGEGEASHGCGCGCGAACGAGAAVFILDSGALVALASDGRRIEAEPEALVPPALVRTGARLTWADPCWPGRAPLAIPFLPLTRDGRLIGPDLPLIAMPKRVPVPRSGSLVFDAFDSERRGFGWDRILLDLDLPENASLILRTLTSETLIEPDKIALEPLARWSRPLTLLPGDLPEILVQSGPGRYLWLRIDLLSDGTSSPQIKRLDIFGPRKSGLRHLPASFHQDPQSRDFLDRFLSYFDTIFAELRQTGREIGRVFDPKSVPEGQWLDWLGSWFDLTFLAEWDVQTRREMVTQAIEQARERGTKSGLGRMVRWHLGLSDPWPMMIEHFRLGPLAPPVAHLPLPVVPEPHRMTLILPRAKVAPEAEARLARLIDSWIPAHVGVTIRYIDSGLTIGQQSLIGIDTLLGGSCPQPLGQARAGIDLGLNFPSPQSIFHFNQTIGERHVGQMRK